MRLTFSLTLVLTSLAGCYNPTILDGQIQCTADTKQCPEGYACFPNNRCYKTGSSPDCSPGCGGGAPVCDKTTLSCVQCLKDNDCAVGSLCVMNQCRPGCSASHPSCADDAGTCDVDMGVCRGCIADTECTDPANPRCDTGAQQCVPCLLAPDNCAMGSYCVKASDGSYACQQGCKDDTECPLGTGQDMAVPPDLAQPDLAHGDLGGRDLGTPPDMTIVMQKPRWACCSHVCADTTKDAANCGSCGKACAAPTCCSSACADTTKDPGNCGGCGVTCNLAHAATTCSGSCQITTCATGFGNCDSVVANGCEASLLNDPNNCGGCHKVCAAVANGVAACKNGQCAIGSCNTGFADCDGTYATGCEVNTQADTSNCGGCKNVCAAVTSGVPACKTGTCTVGTCNTGFADCDGKYSTGCEINTQTDTANCGKCQLTCPSVQNGVAGCAMGLCGIGSCNTNFGDCDGSAANGCEATLLTDNNNCGKCAVACNGSTPSCNNGGCVGLNKRIFVTSQDYQGNLGGLTGADAICQSRANSANLGGTYKAWLSDTTGSPSTRFTRPGSDYVLTDGTLVAHGYYGLVSGSLIHAINLTESRGTPPFGNTACGYTTGQTVWTDTNAFGGLDNSSLTCGNWTSTSGGSAWGSAVATISWWTTGCSGGSCYSFSALYCVEQ